MTNRSPNLRWNPGSPIEVSPEEYERQVLKWIWDSAGNLQDFTATHHGKREGSGGEYEFDIVVEFTVLGGSRILVLVECKRYGRAVEHDRVLAFHAKLRDVNAHKGIMFSTSGFQKGALEYATAHYIATVSFLNGRDIYETQASGPTPEPPPWVHLPRYAGMFMRTTEKGVSSHLLKDDHLEPMEEWLGLPQTLR